MRNNSTLILLFLSSCAIGEEKTPLVEEPSPLDTSTDMAAKPACTCYFAVGEADCPIGYECSEMFSDFGCTRMLPKQGVLGGGCTDPVPLTMPCQQDADCGDQTKPFPPKCIDKVCVPKTSPCDGQCAPATNGTVCGVEPRDRLARFGQIWAEALITTADQGGGKIDPALVASASEVELSPECRFFMSRSVLGIAELCLGNNFIGHPTDMHETLEHRIGDLRRDPCRRDMAMMCYETLLSAVSGGTTELDLSRALPASCRSGPPVSYACRDSAPMKCIEERLEAKVVALTTPEVR